MVSRQTVRLEGEDLRQCLEACVARSELIEEGFVAGTQRALARFENEGLLDGGAIPTPRAPDSAEQEEDWRAMLLRLRALEEQVFGPDRPDDGVRGSPGATAVGRVDDGDGARGSRGAAVVGRVADADDDGARGSRGVAGRSRSPRR